ncbi:hypothetical protein Lsan_2919 [Legionella santicrucis]|uniref:Uncharacterized protein n=1 Tax=Legionella santicrucis TaxID=45074 RepID=A0A0W0YIU3_9GAMM|nr:hypothetical protein [Legionella santicrucis]KTD56759.1 hypothetical protein Lsan_2919 [Legionella santicrucis]
MRKNHLRQFVDNYCRQVHTGSHHSKKHRHYVLHKVIHDLFHIEKVPTKWYGVTTQNIRELVCHWQKEKKSPSTIMKYLTVLRRFFTDIKHLINGIDNHSLGVIHDKKITKTNNTHHIGVNLSNPIAKCLYELQTHFGLTLSEAMRINPETHLEEYAICITRDIATNSRDRIIPVRVDMQSTTLNEFQSLCVHGKSLIGIHGYAPLRHYYSTALKAVGAPTTKSYRPFYAKMIYNELIKAFPSYQSKQIIMREMGLHSRRTLWGYLNE